MEHQTAVMPALAATIPFRAKVLESHGMAAVVAMLVVAVFKRNLKTTTSEALFFAGTGYNSSAPRQCDGEGCLRASTAYAICP